MEYYPSNDYHQGRRYQAGQPVLDQATSDISRELDGRSYWYAPWWAGVRRLNATDPDAYTPAHQEHYERLRGRMFDLTK